MSLIPFKCTEWIPGCRSLRLHISRPPPDVNVDVDVVVPSFKRQRRPFLVIQGGSGHYPRFSFGNGVIGFLAKAKLFLLRRRLRPSVKGNNIEDVCQLQLLWIYTQGPGRGDVSVRQEWLLSSQLGHCPIPCPKIKGSSI